MEGLKGCAWAGFVTSPGFVLSQWNVWRGVRGKVFGLRGFSFSGGGSEGVCVGRLTPLNTRYFPWLAGWRSGWRADGLPWLAHQRRGANLTL